MPVAPGEDARVYMNNEFIMDAFRQRTTREGRVVPAGTYTDSVGVVY